MSGPALSPATGDARTAAPFPVWVQLLVLALVLAVFFIDGVDLQMLAVAVPPLAGAWHVAPSAFALALAMGHVGGAVGATAGGALGDRIGRNTVIVGCLILSGAASACFALAHDPGQLVGLRLLAGLGLGGSSPPAIAVLSDFVSARRRGAAIGLVMLCVPFGAGSAGVMTAFVIPAYGWQALFVAAGLLPVVLAGLVAIALHTLARYSPPADRLPGTEAATSERGARSRFLMPDLAKAEARHFWFGVAGLCCGFFLVYVTVSGILSWLPTLLAGQGLSLQRASGVLSAFSLGGMVATPTLGWAAGQWGTARTIRATTLTGAACAAMIALGAALGLQSTGGVAFYALIAIIGAMVNGAVILFYTRATEVFPPEIRSTGVGVAVTTARIGAVMGTLLGGRVTVSVGVVGFFALAALLQVLTCFASALTDSGGTSGRNGRHAGDASLPLPLPQSHRQA